jgi:Tubulin-tyrosine ligase family
MCDYHYCLLQATDKLFWSIHMVMLRSLMAVERLVISDAAAFELYGYDIMVDDQLKPWLIEVRAC